MGITSYGLLIFLLIIIMSVAGFGSCAGYTVNGVPKAGEVTTENPGIFGVIGWAWGAIVFLFDMAVFRVDNMPEWVSTIFIVMGLLVLWMIIKLIRGTEG